MGILKSYGTQIEQKLLGIKELILNILGTEHVKR